MADKGHRGRLCSCYAQLLCPSAQGQDQPEQVQGTRGSGEGWGQAAASGKSTCFQKLG